LADLVFVNIRVGSILKNNIGNMRSFDDREGMSNAGARGYFHARMRKLHISNLKGASVYCGYSDCVG